MFYEYFIVKHLILYLYIPLNKSYTTGGAHNYDDIRNDQQLKRIIFHDCFESKLWIQFDRVDDAHCAKFRAQYFGV